VVALAALEKFEAAAAAADYAAKGFFAVRSPRAPPLLSLRAVNV